MPFGCPGGDAQPQGMIQTFLNIAVFGMRPQQAIEAAQGKRPGITPTPSGPTLTSREGYGSRVGYRPRPAPNSKEEAMTSRRSTIGPRPTPLSVSAIVVDQENGVLMGGADPRRETYVMGSLIWLAIRRLTDQTAPSNIPAPIRTSTDTAAIMGANSAVLPAHMFIGRVWKSRVFKISATITSLNDTRKAKKTREGQTWIHLGQQYSPQGRQPIRSQAHSHPAL